MTLPGVRYGLISAFFVVFTLVITDFGIAKVIGGQFNVLATDAYKQVIGQQNFQMGAVVGLVLLVPAVLAFVVDRHVQKRQVALCRRARCPMEPKHEPTRDWLCTLYCAGHRRPDRRRARASPCGPRSSPTGPTICRCRSRTTTSREFEPNGLGPYLASLQMAALAAMVGTAIVFVGAYVVEKGTCWKPLRSAAHLLAMLPMAVPGLVLGLGYVFFINAKWNPLGVFYGTLILLAVNSIAHFYTTAHVTAVTALKQIDNEFEAVSQSLKVPFYRTFARVTVPICMPAILDIAVYMFVNAMTTVSAVIFLYGAVDQAGLDLDRAHGRGWRDGGRRRDGDADRADGAGREARAPRPRRARVRQAAGLAQAVRR